MSWAQYQRGALDAIPDPDSTVSRRKPIYAAKKKLVEVTAVNLDLNGSDPVVK
jgi:hypothetical protein